MWSEFRFWNVACCLSDDGSRCSNVEFAVQWNSQSFFLTCGAYSTQFDMATSL